MSGSVIVVALAAVGFLGFAGFMLARLPHVWRGGTMDSLPWNSMRAPTVDHRTFPAATGFMTALALVVAGAALGAVTHAAAIGVLVILVLLPLMVVFFVLLVLVSLANRPRFLVPPPHRR